MTSPTRPTQGLPASTALLTDQYEIAMASALITEGKGTTPAVFDAFARRLPNGRRYGVTAGLTRLTEAIEQFTFTTEQIDWLTTNGIITDTAADWLATFRFSGTIDAYREGDLYFPNSPILTVTGPLAECLLLETVILSILNHDTAIASAAARMVTAARGKPLLEMGSRRTHEDAAVAAARTAYLTGFTGTSNLAAGHKYGVPTIGTAAHAFTLAHTTEIEAFAAQVAEHGTGTTLLVDTYDIEQGIRNAITVAGTSLGAIRIDSGDLVVEARQARALLDSLGATATRIVTTSDLDEYTITALQDGPVDVFGVGTRLVTGSGHPTAGMVYKLVAIADGPDGTYRSVIKKSAGKASFGGRKYPYRTFDRAGHLTGEWFTTAPAWIPSTARPLHVPVMRDGLTVHAPALDEIREFHATVKTELAPEHLDITHGPAATTTQPASAADTDL